MRIGLTRDDLQLDQFNAATVWKLNCGGSARTVLIVLLCIGSERVAHELVIVPADQHTIVSRIECEVRHERVEVAGKLYAP